MRKASWTAHPQESQSENHHGDMQPAASITRCGVMYRHQRFSGSEFEYQLLETNRSKDGAKKGMDAIYFEMS